MSLPLLHYRWKFPGFFLLLSGAVLGTIYFTSDFTIRMPVFAVFSSFLETRMFVTFKTNVADDIILLLLVSGLGLLVGSKEKEEYPGLDAIRLRAFIKAFQGNTFFLIFSILFIFGGGFIGVLILNLFSFSILYLISFYLFKRQLKAIKEE